jgi:hypothetical protein
MYALTASPFVAPNGCVSMQVFVKGEFIGGSDILMELHKAGELGQLAEELTGAAATKQ